MIMSKYVRLTKGLADFGKLIKEDEVDANLTDLNKDYYTSLYYYTDDHLKRFKETGTVKGIKDVTTNKLWFDFDSKEDPSLAQKDAKVLVGRLITSGIKPAAIQVYFTGSKGFHVIVETNRTLTPEQVASLAINKFGKGLNTFDPSLYDAPQVLRVAGTKHNSTGLYKIPLTVSQLNTMTIEAIKTKAKSLDNITDDFNWDTANLTDDLLKVEETKKEEPRPELSQDEVDFLNKPKQWRSCKWSLLQGNFKSGQRHDALMTIAATCKGLGYDKETTYYMCKSALKKQALKHNTDEFPKDELYNNVVDSVFTEGWEGGQYSCQKPGWLQKYCKELGRHSCTASEGTELIDVNSIYATFEDYAKNFERNVVKTGIRELDENVMFLTSTHNGILGQPGSGKTSLAVQWLCESSKQGSASIFYSLDMGKPVIYGKLVQKYLGCSLKDAIRICKENPSKLLEVRQQIERDFKNVKFNFKSAVTPDIIRQDIKDHEAATGQKVRLIITDYLECMSGPYSDSLANVAFISQQMKDIANEFQVCSVMLLQTQKHSTADISDPLMSMKQIKGSSVIEQSSSVILSLWREGYSPKTVEDDKYMSFACVKNRFGSLWTDNFKWSGRNGLISELTEEEKFELEEFKKRKAQAKADAAADSGNGGWS